MSYCYVLQCFGGSYYTGSTRNIKRRLRNHRKGRVKFTKGKRPVKMIFLKEFVNYSQAYQFEKKIKSWKKRVSIERMLSKSDNIADTI